MIPQVDQSHKSINQTKEINQSKMNSSNNIDSFLLEQAEAEKQKAIEKERIDKEIKEDLKKIKVNFSNLYKVNRSRSLEQQKQESQLRINQIFITKSMVQNQNYPISPNFKKEIEELFDLNIIKPFESPALKEKFYEILTQDKIVDLQKYLFWLVFMKNFPQQIKGQQTMLELKDQINYKFTKIFNSMPKPKDEILNYMLFCITYVIHKTLFDFFKEDRHIFNLRFILDCYHIVIEEINGVNVTDFFLQVNIDRVFSYKFLEYEKTKSALQRTRKIVIQKDRNYFGQILEPCKPKTEEQFQFHNQIKDILKKKKNIQKQDFQTTNASPQMTNKFKRFHLGLKKLSSKASQANSRNSEDSDKDNSETNSIKVTDHRTSIQDDKNKRNPWYNQSFIFMQQGRGHKIIDRNTYQKIKRNKKVELEHIQEKFVNQQGDEFYNIAPSLRVKASGRDISYQRLRFNLNGISPTIKGELGLRERSLPDTLQKVIFHPIDRVIKMNNYNQIVENSKQKLLQQINEIEEKSYEDLNPLIQGNFNQKNENENQGDSNQKKLEQVEQQQGQQLQKNKKNSKSSEIFKNKIQKKSQQPKSILAQYDLSHGQFGKNEISKNPMIYKDMLEMKMVLNVYREKTTNLPSSKRLEQRKFQGIKDDIIERTLENNIQTTQNIQSKSLSPKHDIQNQLNNKFQEQSASQINYNSKDQINVIQVEGNQFRSSQSLNRKQSEHQIQNTKIQYDVEEKEKLLKQDNQSKIDSKQDINDYLSKDKTKEFQYISKQRDYTSKYYKLTQQSTFEKKIKLSPKEMQFKLIKQRTALSKKGAGWNIYQHLIDFND